MWFKFSGMSDIDYRLEINKLKAELNKTDARAQKLKELVCQYRAHFISFGNVLGSKYTTSRQVLEDLIALLDSKDELEAKVKTLKEENEKLKTPLNLLKIRKFENEISECEKLKSENSKLKAYLAQLQTDVKQVDSKDRCKVCEGYGAEWVWYYDITTDERRKIRVFSCLQCEGTGKEIKDKSDKIDACPWCKSSENVRLGEYSFGFDTEKYKVVYCANENCQAHGPIGASENEAIRKWNK